MKTDSAILRYGCVVRSSVRTALLAVIVISVVLLLASEADGIVKGSTSVAYELGGAMVNYSAGFVRRGLFGEAVMQLNALCQPVLTMLFISSLSVLSIFYVFLSRLIRLGIRLPYVLAIVFSPSLILMYRGENFLRLDPVIIVPGLAASVKLLKLITGNKMSSGGRHLPE